MKTGIENQNDGAKGFQWESKNNDLNQSNYINNQHYFHRIDADKIDHKSTLKDDIDLKKSVMNIIKWNSSIDESKISIKVKNGWVTLEGIVDLDFKRLKAGLLARDINGVTGVTNMITVSSGTA
ncbi:MAG: BON domain-containing protein [Bacteroidota bacterium]